MERGRKLNVHMESENSLFETSEIFANLLSSTSLLPDSWKLCDTVNSASPAERFVMNQIGSVGYIAFSGAAAQIVNGMSDLDTNLMPLSGVCDDIFSVLDRCGGGSTGGVEEVEVPTTVMVHSGLLKVFWDVYSCPSFKTQMPAMLKKSKSIILTGHSIGGTTASLMTLSLLCHLHTCPSPPHQVLCITFGTPLLGNASLSRSIQRQKWDGNFCHVVLKHDIVPRLFFAPLASLDAHLRFVLQCRHLSAPSTSDFGHLVSRIPDQDKARLFNFILTCTQARAGQDYGVDNKLEEAGKESFWPFGSYLFCSEVGILCVENAVAVVRLLYLMLATADANSCILDHLKYGEYVAESSFQFRKRKDYKHWDLPKASYEAGLAFAVESSGLAIQEAIAESTKDCLRMEKRMGLTPNLNSAGLAIKLSKITPHRAQIEWYKACCDKSDDQMGYYDSFKKRQASRRDNAVNIFRLKLACFWDKVINMIDNNTLPHDLHKRAKWVNASRFYQLLVEPLDIAEYYRSGMHRTKGHYIQKGRERRHQVFNKWWREKHGSDERMERTKFAGLTEDPCFWARVEEARESLEKIRSERDSNNVVLLWEDIRKFELYALQLIQNKEVSVDVLAKNSSYTLWVEELAELRSQLQQFPTQHASFINSKVVP